jgi:hypothetical protein
MFSVLGVASGLAAFGASFAISPDWHFQWYWRKEFQFLNSKFYRSIQESHKTWIWTKAPAWGRRILGCGMFSTGVFILYTIGTSMGS